jgi:uncharacterized protein (DUF924 family)
VTEPVGPEVILDFWFSPQARLLWFEKDAAFDDEIRVRFGATVAAAQAGAFDDWCAAPRGALALLILLDQMARNIHRGSARAFAGDPRAIEIARNAIAAGHDAGLGFQQRRFFYLPFEHCEEPAAQRRSLDLFRDLAAGCEAHEIEDAKDQLEAAERHAEIIARFGRFPHRNATLGRASTAEEVEFLAGPNSSF